MRRVMRNLVPALLLLFPIAAGAQTSKLTSVQKVVEGVWMAQTSQGSNVGWFLVGDEVIAVDSGNDAATGQAVLEKIEETAHKPVRYLIVTHAHGDHGGGAGAFAAAGAEIVCHENAASGLTPIIAASLRKKPGLLAFSERFGLLGATRRVAVYYLGPAHTAGDIVVLLPEEKVLFTGDVVLATGAPYMQSADVDPDGWEKILGRLAQLDVNKIVPGHGALGTKKAIDDTFGYIKKVEDVARTIVDENVDENLIEARLRVPDMGLEASTITPTLLGNVRAVVRAQKKKAATTPATTPAAKPAKAPAAKKS
jgi:cyclase